MIPVVLGCFTRNVPRKRGPRINTVEGAKWCPRCAARKSVEASGFDRTREDGLSGWCRSCRARQEKARRDGNLSATNAKLRARYRRNPARFKAHVHVARAVEKGILVKPIVCPICKLARRIEAHHHAGYARENWLNVVWRCRQCHALEHKRGVVRQVAAAA